MKKIIMSLSLLLAAIAIFLYTQGRTTIVSDNLDNQLLDNAPFIDLTTYDSFDVDIPYAKDGQESHLMDLYFPDEVKPYKVILVIHGDGWMGGDKRSKELEPIVRQAVKQGYAVASIEYRNPNEIAWPAQLYDAKAAVRYLRANGFLYDLDTDAIIVWGDNIGGHIALMLGATNNRSEFEDLSMGNAKASSSVQGIISRSGITDLSDFPKNKLIANKVIGFNISELLERDSIALEQGVITPYRYEEWLKILQNASPLKMVSEDFPPTLLIHGTEDNVIPCRQSIQMYREIIRRCDYERASLRLIRNAGYNSQLINNKENAMEDIDWIDELFYPFGR